MLSVWLVSVATVRVTNTVLVNPQRAVTFTSIPVTFTNHVNVSLS